MQIYFTKNHKKCEKYYFLMIISAKNYQISKVLTKKSLLI